MLKIVNGVKYYPVSQNMQFNLEACHDKLSLMMWEAERNGDWKLAEEIEARRDEADRLAWNGGWLSGKDYGKAKELVAWRIEQRIQANIEGGNLKNLQYC
jgi:hypothetical protein